MRQINEIIIHCSDTPYGMDFNASDIDTWHRNRGFSCIGYHYVITIDGKIEQGRPLERIGAHCLGHNDYSIGICYVGGRLFDGSYGNSMTDEQVASMCQLLHSLKAIFPNATIHGHNEFSSKLCPCFDVQNFIKDLGL